MLTQRKLYSLSSLSGYLLIVWWGPGMKEELFFLIREEEMRVFEHLLCVRNFIYQSVSSVTQLCLTLCDPMDCSKPGFPVHHQLPELAQTWVGMMPSNHLILCCPLLLLPSVPASIRVFSNESMPGSSLSRVQGYPQDGQRWWMNEWHGRPSFSERGPSLYFQRELLYTELYIEQSEKCTVNSTFHQY